MNTLRRIIVIFMVLLVCTKAEAAVEKQTESQTESNAMILESVWVSMRVRVPTPDELNDAGGFGVLLFNEALPIGDDEFTWDEPNRDHAIGIGFDVHNPQPTDLKPDENGRVMGWFDSPGNWYDRPQREISVHANGTERLNVLSVVEFRTGDWIDISVQLRYQPGGAHVVVSIDGTTVLDDMIWGVRPMPITVTSGVVGDSIEIQETEIVHSTLLSEIYPTPIHVEVFNEAFLANAARLKSTIDFSAVPKSVERVIATLTLSEPEVGYDHWDKKGTIGISVPHDNSNTDYKVETPTRFEVFRFITPYRRGWTWHMDVTDLLPLFKDKRELDAHIGTYMKGWNVSFSLDFYPGAPERTPIKIVKLWSGDAEIGNPESPVDEFYKSIAVGVPEGATSARVRMTVTGHGMSPNSLNAGEFMPIWRTLTIRSENPTGDVLAGDFIAQSERNHLWKTDVYLNPCRPQGGTWKFDRAGWAPGDKVEPWKVDTQREFIFGDHIVIEYTLDEYINEGRGETWAPHHWTDAVLVFYK